MPQFLQDAGSENADNRVAGLCGQEDAQQFTGTTNKGQCIQVLRAMEGSAS